MNTMFAAAALLTCAALLAVAAGNLQTINEWNLLQYDVPFNYPNADSYKPEVTVSTGIEVGKRDPFFMKTLQPNFKLLARRV
jgi:hypothetical protein